MRKMTQEVISSQKNLLDGIIVGCVQRAGGWSGDLLVADVRELEKDLADEGLFFGKKTTT